VDSESRLALRLRFQSGPYVHSARIEPDEEWFLVAVRALNEIRGRLEEFLVDRFHALLGKRPGVLAFLLAPGAEAGIIARRVSCGGRAFQHAARSELRPECGILRVVSVLRFILGIEMVEIAEELIEAVYGGQEFTAIAKMVLAKLSGRVSLRFQQFCDGRILV